MAARRRTSAQYRERNEEELKAQARERMARRRAQLKKDPVLAEDARARAREASQRFRQKHSKDLAWRQRLIRMECGSIIPYLNKVLTPPRRKFVDKHGNAAWNERRERQIAAAKAAQEEEDMKRYQREGAVAMAAFEVERARSRSRRE
ncbi:hypothetical protein B0H11DRAFT_2257584 [Mycena galericulata]|nr:hypothetical protein B0H11DRAFT_2257584 [Mycena galericulata]